MLLLNLQRFAPEISLRICFFTWGYYQVALNLSQFSLLKINAIDFKF